MLYGTCLLSIVVLLIFCGGNYALIGLQQVVLVSIRKVFLNMHLNFVATLPQFVGLLHFWLLKDFLSQNMVACYELANVFDIIYIRTAYWLGEETKSLMLKILFGDLARCEGALACWKCHDTTFCFFSFIFTFLTS